MQMYKYHRQKKIQIQPFFYPSDLISFLPPQEINRMDKKQRQQTTKIKNPRLETNNNNNNKTLKIDYA